MERFHCLCNFSLRFLGIGFETAKVFARLGATVVLACRSGDRGEAARQKLISELSSGSGTIDGSSLSQRIQFMRLDLASFSSIREFVDNFNKAHNRLDILVDNAGVMSMTHELFTNAGSFSVFKLSCTKLCL